MWTHVDNRRGRALLAGALDTLALNTLGGNDTVNLAPDVSTLINPVVDLGADQ